MVSIQQASANALANYLSTTLTGGVTVDTRWPSPDMPLQNKVVTVLLAGSRQDEFMEPQIMSYSNVGSTQSSVLFRLKACTQPMQLDIWTTSDVERDDIIAQLDIALNVGEASYISTYVDPVGPGCLLAVADGWPASTTADFVFENPRVDDSPESVKRSEYRATFTGNCYVALSVTKTTARQITTHFKENSGLFDVPLF